MKVIPAVDLLDGKAVQLRGGIPEQRLWEHDDPVAVAQDWWDQGAEHLHVVDLGNALNMGENTELIQAILAEAQGPVTVGGGLRTTTQMRAIFDAHPEALAVVATRAWRDPLWLDHITEAWPQRVVVALELKHGTIAVSGWTERLKLTLEEGIFRLVDLPIGGMLFTDVDREGRMKGPNTETARQACEALDAPVYVSGGVSTLENVRDVARAGAAGCIIGTAFYTGALDLAEAQAAAREVAP
ncbi:MAG: HisA/HisF-related TIM barrel protein [Candidatus Thermoplasmatota archaeon]|nr:HisA/HisF-related TIM barrel protein [Candidatus Thermoplasmatota archaeon]